VIEKIGARLLAMDRYTSYKHWYRKFKVPFLFIHAHDNQFRSGSIDL
jgi:hypothetical protein